MPGMWSGSSGYTSASRIRSVVEHFLVLPSASQTSARFAEMWSSRAVEFLDPPDLSYIIGGGEGNSASGWSSYVYRLYGSTRNTSSGGTYAIRGLPDQPMRDFRADRTVLQAATSAISGTGDAAQGQRLYQFLVSSAITTGRYNRGGPHQEILLAWAAVGSSAAPTS
jgi:hypothetical protein